MGGEVLAKYESSQVQWQHRNPVTGSQRWTTASGGMASLHASTELDPMGVDAGVIDWVGLQMERQMGQEFIAPRFGDSLNLAVGCEDGSAPAACAGDFQEILRGGGSAMFQGLGRRRTWDGWRKEVERARAYDLGLGTFYGGSLMGLHEQEHVYNMYAGLLAAQDQINSGYRFADGVPRSLSLSLASLAFAPQDSSIWSNDWQKLRYQGVSLSPCAKRVLSDLFNGSALNVNDLRVRVGIPQSLKDFATISPGAVTIGNTIYLDAGSLSKYDASTVSGLANLAHEAWHALQYANGLTKSGYLWESSKQWWNGKDPYWDNKYEKEAYQVQDIMKEYIKNTYGDDPCGKLGLSPKAR